MKQRSVIQKDLPNKMTWLASIKLVPEAALCNDKIITRTSVSFLKFVMAFVLRHTLLLSTLIFDYMQEWSTTTYPSTNTCSMLCSVNSSDAFFNTWGNCSTLAKAGIQRVLSTYRWEDNGAVLWVLQQLSHERDNARHLRAVKLDHIELCFFFFLLWVLFDGFQCLFLSLVVLGLQK